ncbi:hypothetical protein J4729_08745 [Leisingera sp. HS039]|uniref:hypothetical protein n=2 Tax=unclassified Leisingera TaxID=2614906 RepID=UPI001B39FC1E|nr:hypothetical protein [Leisingera sp. HS039]MBQ4824629.1 hypothetical protein [Leisingera sp. HS039]
MPPTSDEAKRAQACQSRRRTTETQQMNFLNSLSSAVLAVAAGVIPGVFTILPAAAESMSVDAVMTLFKQQRIGALVVYTPQAPAAAADNS